MLPEKHEALNKGLNEWLLIFCSENVPVSGLLLKENALEFVNQINIEDFQASEGWLEKCKIRYYSL